MNRRDAVLVGTGGFAGRLAEEGRRRTAAAYAVGTLALALPTVLLGLALGRLLAG